MARKESIRQVCENLSSKQKYDCSLQGSHNLFDNNDTLIGVYCLRHIDQTLATLNHLESRLTKSGE